MEEQRPRALYEVVVLKAPDPDAVAQLVSQRVGRPFNEVRQLAAMAPAKVATNIDAIMAEDLVINIKGLGADAEKRLIPSSTTCPVHKDQQGRAVCQVCGKVICTLCLRESGAKPICPECRGEGEEKIKVGFAWGRIIILLLIASAAGYVYYSLTKPRPQFAWNRPYKLAVVGFMVNLPPQWRQFINKFNEQAGKEYVDLHNHTLPDMTGWFQREYKRYGGTMEQALELSIFGPFDEMEPPPMPPGPDMKFSSRFIEYKKFKSWFTSFNNRHKLDLAEFDSVIYVHFVGGEFDGFMETYGSRHDDVTLINCYLDFALAEIDIMLVIHELMHLLNAKDHYDENFLPINPEGFAQPFELPLYPQTFAEIMAGRIPRSESSAQNIRSIRDLRVGIYTAFEIGLIDKTQLQAFEMERKTPPMD